MAVMSRLLPLVAYSTFAIFLLALLATPANALANDGRAHVVRGHDSIAKRKRSAVKRAKRCRPQSSSSSAFAAVSTSPAASYGHSATATPSAVPTTSKTHSTTPTTTYAPATTSTTSKAVATTSAAPSTGGGNGVNGSNLSSSSKLMWAWPNGPNDLSSKWVSSRLAGMYTWSPSCPSNVGTIGSHCWPMLWGSNQKDDFAKIDGSKAGLCFGFNEPNQDGQSDMSPQDGAALWKSHMEPKRAQGCKLVSPATTSSPTGKKWIQDFLTACNGGCNFDYVAIHWYDVSISAFQAYVTDFHTTFGKPIIVSEYACQNFNGGAQCSSDDTWALHTTMAKWFDQTDYVALYAPFGAMREMQGVNADNQLMNNDGTPNSLALWYMGNHN